MKFLVDTNILITSVFFKRQWCIKLLNQILDNPDNLLIIDNYMLSEFCKAIFKKKIFKYMEYKSDKIMGKIIKRKENLWDYNIREINKLIFKQNKYKIIFTIPPNEFKIKCRDSKDNMVIYAALANGVDAIISNDKDLLCMSDTLKVPVRTLNQALEMDKKINL